MNKDPATRISEYKNLVIGILTKSGEELRRVQEIADRVTSPDYRPFGQGSQNAIEIDSEIPVSVYKKDVFCNRYLESKTKLRKMNQQLNNLAQMYSGEELRKKIFKKFYNLGRCTLLRKYEKLVRLGKFPIGY